MIKQFVLGTGRPEHTEQKFKNVAIINSFITPIQPRPFELLIKLAVARRQNYPGKTSFEQIEADPNRVWKLIYLLRNQLDAFGFRDLVVGDKEGHFWLRVEPKTIRFKVVLLGQKNDHLLELLSRCRLV